MSTEDRPFRSIFTFVQQTTPTGAVEGDTWYQPGYQMAWQWDGAQWIVFSPVSDPVGYAGIAGYFAGGTVSTSGVTQISKLDFRFESCVLLSAGLNTARSSTGASRSDSHGYVAGGYSGAPVSSVEKLRFSTDLCSNLVSTLTSVKYGCAAPSSGICGYHAGGLSSTVSIVDKIIFSSDSISQMSGNLSVNTAVADGTQSSSAGFVCGGYDGGATYYSTIRKITFTGDAVSSLLSGLTIARRSCTAMESSAAAYLGGGFTGVTHTRIDKMLFSNESVSVNSSSLMSVNSLWEAGASSRVSGYVSGDAQNAALGTTIQRLSYSSDAVAFLAASNGRAGGTQWNGFMGFENLAR